MLARVMIVALVALLAVAAAVETADDGTTTHSMYPEAYQKWASMLKEYHGNLNQDMQQYYNQRKEAFDALHGQLDERYKEFKNAQVDFYNWYIGEQKKQFEGTLETQHMHERHKIEAAAKMRQDVYATYISQEQEKMNQLKKHFDDVKQHPFMGSNPHVHNVLEPQWRSEVSAHSNHLDELRRAQAYDQQYTQHMLASIDREYKAKQQNLQDIPTIPASPTP